MAFTPPRPPIWKCTLFGEYTQAPAGWSENYYIPGPQAADALVKLQAIKDARRDLMQSEYRFTYMRVSDAGIKGDAYIKYIAPAAQFGTIDAAPMPPVVAAIVREETNDGYHIDRYLHGLALDQLLDNQQADPAKHNWAAAFTAYNNIIQADTIMWVKDKVTGVYEQKAVVNVLTQKVRSHKIGRPFDLYRGRRAKKRKP